MYSKIINPKTNKYVTINSKLGKSILKKYIGGKYHQPTSKLDLIRNIPAKDKHLPHYIENSKCKPITYKLGYNIQTGDIKSKLTLLDKIRLFYNNVFNIRKNVVDRKTSRKDYVYDNAIRCNIFLDKDTETPEKFKQKIYQFREDSKKLLRDLQEKKRKINKGVFDPIKTINNISKLKEWKTKPINLYIQTTNLKEFIETIEKECTLIIDTIESKIKEIKDSVTELETKIEKLFNFSWTSGDVNETLIKVFYDLKRNIDDDFVSYSRATYSYMNSLNEDFIMKKIEDHVNDLKYINANKLSVSQVREVLFP